ncbi:hypothetical protein QN277_018435 [Acacia crassicarpa]|uniref:BAH domain-containing protein n=1 Tax=Acacia crassicarpa TaxID=499986 RepID=A0AAE1MSN1_9FABA|nr:hypothetical protein QN277_018435 [Acacia crassicarpa]
MATNAHRFVEWKEQFISQERGNRVVHYYLKDSAGDSILAVVGTERSLRHMFYVVAEEFLEVCGKEGAIHAGFKWRSRREVVDWLTSMLSKQHQPGDKSVLPSHNLTQAHETTNRSLREFIDLHTRISDKGLLMSSFKGHNSDIVWSGVAWTCGKQLKHYPAFYRNGIKIAIQSFVFVMATGETHYIAYLEDMYEDRRGQKKVKVRWFHHNQEVKGMIPVKNTHPQEVFITSYSQVISAECVDGPATVLTREHYERLLPAFSPASSNRIHMCFRQFRSNKVKAFDLSKLRGYLDQPVLSCLNLDSFRNPKCNNLAEEDEELSLGDDVRPEGKRRKRGRGSSEHLIDHQGVRKLSRSQQMMVDKTVKNVDYSRPGRRLLSQKQVDYQPWYSSKYEVDDKIELLCQDSGIRGCWFRCTVVQVSRKQIKVQYIDVQDEDGGGNLEEWIPAFKLAMPDKLGMRHSGRPTIRPAPTNEGQQELAVGIGTAVDAWWSDGWWEGVVSGIDDCDDDNVHVYFPGEGLLRKICKKDLRVSRDWVGDRWVDIERNPNVASTVFAVNSSNNTKFSATPSTIKDADSSGVVISCQGVPISEKSNNEQNDVAEDMNMVIDNKPPSQEEASKEASTEVVETEQHGSCDNKDNHDDGNEDKEENDGDYNKRVDNVVRDMEVCGTSGEDSQAVAPMEVAV